MLSPLATARHSSSADKSLSTKPAAPRAARRTAARPRRRWSAPARAARRAGQPAGGLDAVDLFIRRSITTTSGRWRQRFGTWSPSKHSATMTNPSLRRRIRRSPERTRSWSSTSSTAISASSMSRTARPRQARGFSVAQRKVGAHRPPPSDGPISITPPSNSARLAHLRAVHGHRTSGRRTRRRAGR